MLLGKAITDKDYTNTFMKQHMASLFPKKGRWVKSPQINNGFFLVLSPIDIVGKSSQASKTLYKINSVRLLTRQYLEKNWYLF